jgi:PadR family transcriptional regulator PadR
MVPSTAEFAQMRRGSVEFCVLALLRNCEMYGVEISDSLMSVGTVFDRPGTLYPLLARLQRERLVTSELRPSDKGAARRYYKITQDGLISLQAFVARWRLFRDAIDSILGEESYE